MKAIEPSPPSDFAWRLLRRLFIGVGLVLWFLNPAAVVLGQSDDFNDGDDVGWTHVDYGRRGGPVARFSVTNGAYRLYYLISSNQMATFGFPRVASYHAGYSYEDFYLQVDLLDWERQTAICIQGFGLMARAQSDIQTNGFSGYFFIFEPTQLGSPVYLVRFEPDGSACVCPYQDLGLQDPTRKYRLVFTGQGATLTGQIYDLNDLTAPLGEVSLGDGLYREGVCGLWGFDEIGYANFHGQPTPFSPNDTGPIDATFDHYIATNSSPPVNITRHPSTQIVVESDPVTFSVRADGAPPHTYQWVKDGLDIADANKARYSTRAELADNGAIFSVRVSNALGTQTSSNAILTVLTNVTPPRVVNAVGMFDPTQIVVTFSKPMLPLVANDHFNYAVEAAGTVPLGVFQAELTNATTVLLTTEARLPDLDYVLTVSNLRDNTVEQLQLSPNPTQRNLAQEVQLVAGDTQLWSYFQSNHDPGNGWPRPDFDDTTTGWAIGPAVFDAKRPPGRTEVGSEPVRTMLNLTNPPTAPEITRTYYFRTRFSLPRAIQRDTLKLRCFVDDGAVFYVNGAEAFRFNMPPPPTVITYDTFSATFRDAEVYEGPYEVAVTNLVIGDNVLAAEVHQANLGSSDIDFAAQLTAILPPPPARLRVTRSGARLTISWAGAGHLLEEAPTIRGPWSVSPVQDNPQVIALRENIRFYRTRQ